MSKDLKVVKLITEEAENINLVESVGTNGSKDLFLEGIYSTHSKENKNGRKYKEETLHREVNKLYPEIQEKRLYGELNHPEKPDVDLKNVCILIENLTWKNENLMGRSYVIESPMGDIVRGCLKRGIVGISSRGLGSVGADGWVNEDYQMLTYDVVSTPSNTPSWVKGICESKAYYMNESGVIVKSESILAPKEITEATNDAMSDMQKNIAEMVAAAVEEKMERVSEEAGKQKEANPLSKEDATKLYSHILKARLIEHLNMYI